MPLCESPRDVAELLADYALDPVPEAEPPPPTCDCTACHYGAGACEDTMKRDAPTTVGGVAERLFGTPLGDELAAIAAEAAHFHVSVVLGATETTGHIAIEAQRQYPELNGLARRVTEADSRAALVVRRLW